MKPSEDSRRGTPLGVHPSHQRQGPAKIAKRGIPLWTHQSHQRRYPVKIAERGIPLWTGQNHKVLPGEDKRGGGFPPVLNHSTSIESSTKRKKHKRSGSRLRLLYVFLLATKATSACLSPRSQALGSLRLPHMPSENPCPERRSRFTRWKLKKRRPGLPRKNTGPSTDAILDRSATSLSGLEPRSVGSTWLQREGGIAMQIESMNRN